MLKRKSPNVENRKIKFVYFDNPKYEILADFFICEVDSFEDYLEERINCILSGKSEEEFFGGNGPFGITIKKDKSVLEDMFAKAGEDYVILTLDTKELVESFKEWKEHKKIIKQKWMQKRTV